MSGQFELISVIMAAYNAERTIEDAVKSVLSQTVDNFELLIVNDCSTDATESIVVGLSQKDKRIRIINNHENRGVSYSRLRAAQEAIGTWIAILDSDDMWTSDKLEKQIRLQKEKNADLLYTGSAFMDADGKKLNWRMHVPTELTYRQLLKQNLLSNSSAFVRKELYKKFYAEGDGMHEDFATWLQILKAGKVAYGVDEPLLIYRLDKASKSGNKIKSAIMNWKTYRNVGLNVFEAMYYECIYAINGLLKYNNLRV